MTYKKRRLFNIDTKEDGPPNIIKAKIENGEIVGTKRLGKGELDVQRGKLFLDLYGRTKDGHDTKLRLVVTYTPDPKKILENADDTESYAERKQKELSYRLQSDCKFLLEKYTKEYLKQNQGDVTTEIYSKLEFAINNLEGFRVIDYFSNLKFLKKGTDKSSNKNSIEDFFGSTNAFEELDEAGDAGKDSVIKKLSDEYSSWYVANHPEYSKKTSFWQPIYAKAFEIYFGRIENDPALKQKKFEDVVSKKEIEQIVEDSFVGGSND
jgi:hypothetical protein